MLLIRLQLDTLAHVLSRSPPLPPSLFDVISCPRFPWKLNLLHNYAQTMLLRVICSYLWFSRKSLNINYKYAAWASGKAWSEWSGAWGTVDRLCVPAWVNQLLSDIRVHMWGQERECVAIEWWATAYPIMCNVRLDIAFEIDTAFRNHPYIQGIQNFKIPCSGLIWNKYILFYHILIDTDLRYSAILWFDLKERNYKIYWFIKI